jgi:predicted secreted hydrolase
VVPGGSLRFPRDHGAHPEFRTEWWYITGSLYGAEAAVTVPNSSPRFGFQITFFRSRVDTVGVNPSRFAARQLLFAHAAITDLRTSKLLHANRIARAGFGLAESSEADTRVHIRDWRLLREDVGRASTYRMQAADRDFSFSLIATTESAPLLQGDAGYSRKGPKPQQASYYYSRPQLQVRGELRSNTQAQRVLGTAWLDHEWSEEILDTDAVGWDWIGMNLLDGSALTAFRLRRADGNSLWADGSVRTPQGTARSFAANEVQFEPLRLWVSPATQAKYPVEWRVRCPAGEFTVKALLDNQELDSSSSTGTIYWEGISELRDMQGRLVGRGYLEMTGYAERLRLQ